MKKKHDVMPEAGEFLTAVGLDPNKAAKVTTTVDPRTIPVTEIVFTSDMLDKFETLEGRAPADYLFDIYKMPGKNTERNSLLWKRVGMFISEERTKRKTGGLVKEKIKTTQAQRDLAQSLAAAGIDETNMGDLIEALKMVAKKKEEGR